MQTAIHPNQPQPTPLPRSRVLSGILVGLSFQPAPPTLVLQVDGQSQTFPASPELVEYALRFRGKEVKMAILIIEEARALSLWPAGEVLSESERSEHLLERWSGLLEKLA